MASWAAAPAPHAACPQPVGAACRLPACCPAQGCTATAARLAPVVPAGRTAPRLQLAHLLPTYTSQSLIFNGRRLPFSPCMSNVTSCCTTTAREAAAVANPHAFPRLVIGTQLISEY